MMGHGMERIRDDGAIEKTYIFVGLDKRDGMLEPKGLVYGVK